MGRFQNVCHTAAAARPAGQYRPLGNGGAIGFHPSAVPDPLSSAAFAAGAAGSAAFVCAGDAPIATAEK